MKFVWVLVLGCFIGVVSENKDMLITVNRIECMDIDTSFATNLKCILKLKSRTKRLITVVGTLTQNLTSIWIQTQMFYKYNIVYEKFLIDINSDYCAMQTGKSSSKMLKMLLEIVLPSPDSVHKCPYLKGEVLNFTEVDLKREAFPAFLPAGDYRFDISLKAGTDKVIFKVKAFFNVKGIGIKDFSMG